LPKACEAAKVLQNCIHVPCLAKERGLPEGGEKMMEQ